MDRVVSIEASGHESSKFQVQSSKRQAVSSTLNLELFRQVQTHCPRPERLTVNFANSARSVARLAANFSGVWVKMACSLWKFFLYKEAQARISGLHEIRSDES